jgi:guanyl-specific ribonuclease Sa
MHRSRLLLVAVLVAAAWLGWARYRDATAAPGPAPGPASPPLSVGRDDGLPVEARDTLALIARGGPFPHQRDGVTFGNFEKRLPERPRGYYREYTVPTPGVGHRGARRIVTGGDPPTEFFYTDDHYESFRRIGGTP